MPVRAVEPDKGGRGIEQLRLFWTPNPAAARMRGTSCYINLEPACKALPDCAGAFPFHMISTSHGRRKQPWSSETRVAEGVADRSCRCSSHPALRHAHRR
jgi:hypothetical protein